MQIVTKITLVIVKDEGLKISNQLRNLSRSEYAERCYGLKITNFWSCSGQIVGIKSGFF